jgi:hypothetical protein
MGGGSSGTNPSPTLGQNVTGGAAGVTGARELGKSDAPPRTPDFSGPTGKPEPMRMMQDPRLPLPKHKVNRLAVDPSFKPDETRKPFGTPEKVPSDPSKMRAIVLQNESAKILAQAGYNIEQNPKLSHMDRLSNPWLNPNKKPDFKIEGEIFDCYAPNPNTDARNIVSQIRKGKIEQGQTRRIVLNLEDSRVSLNSIQDALRKEHMPELEEIIVIKDGKVLSWFPFEKPTPVGTSPK